MNFPKSWDNLMINNIKIAIKPLPNKHLIQVLLKVLIENPQFSKVNQKYKSVSKTLYRAHNTKTEAIKRISLKLQVKKLP
jgi:hypothetical protein